MYPHSIRVVKPGRTDADLFEFECQFCRAKVSLSRRRMKRRSERVKWMCAKCGCKVKGGCITAGEKAMQTADAARVPRQKLYPCRTCGIMTVNRFHCPTCLNERVDVHGPDGAMYGGFVAHGRKSCGGPAA